MKAEKLIQIEEKEIFADPTYDVTFKMLFGNDKNKDILINFLNNLLDFKGEKEIIDAVIISNELPVEGFSSKKDKKSGIKSAVDVLCITTSGQEIAIEMQNKQKDYFLTRTQEYMSKLISGQVKEGQGAEYDTAVLDTHILIIGKQNMFRGKFALKNQNLFEIDVIPTIVQTGEEMPGNKMHWKFFELSKFAKNYKGVVIDKLHSLKEQWLDFFLRCNTQNEIPDNINDIIKKGYNIMKIANLSNEQKVLYWKEKQDELDALKEQELLKQELAEKAFKEGEFKGIQKEKARSVVKNEISNIKFGIENELPEEKIVKKLNYTKPYFQVIQEHLNNGHFDDTESVIGDHLHLFDMDIEY